MGLSRVGAKYPKLTVAISTKRPYNTKVVAEEKGPEKRRLTTAGVRRKISVCDPVLENYIVRSETILCITRVGQPTRD